MFVCCTMHDSADRCLESSAAEHWETTEQRKSGFRLFLNGFCEFKFSRVLIFALFSFSAKYVKIKTLCKKGLYSVYVSMAQAGDFSD